MAVRLLVNAVVTGQRQVDTLQNSVGRLSRQARFLQTALIGAFAAQGIGGLIRGVTEATDTVTQLQNQLTAAGVAAEGIAAAQADVVRLADMTRSSIEATGGLYARVLRSTRELGISQQQGLDISRAFQQTLALSGASTQEAASASLQFGQALASGRLQGDELRSILENNSFFAQAFARELGVGVGQLRRMGAEGELTSELLADVALRIAPMVNEQFAALQPTFAQAGQVLRNELLLATNELGQTLRGVLGDVVALARGFGGTLGSGIRRFALVVESLQMNAAGLNVVLTALGSLITTILIPAILRLATAIAVRLASSILLVLSPIGTLVAVIASIGFVALTAGEELTRIFAAIVERLSILGEQVGLFFEALPDRAQIAAAGFAEGFVNGLDDVGETIINALLTPINAVIERANELGAGLSLLSVDIPDIGLDIDTSEAEANLMNLQGAIDETNARAAMATGNITEGFGDLVDAVVMAATMGTDAIRGVFAAFEADLPDLAAGEGPMGMMAPMMEENVENALLEGVRGIDTTRLGMDFEDNLERGLSEAFNEGDLSGIGSVFVTSFQESINEQFAEQISGVFGNVFESITGNAEGFGAGLSETFSGIFDSISMLFSGGDGGGFGGLLSAGLGLFGFQNGGIVPGPSGPGPDNRIIAARSGELILNRAQQDNLANQLNSQGMTVNQTIQVTGDVTTATRRAVREMGDEITNTVQQRFNERGVLR